MLTATYLSVFSYSKWKQKASCFFNAALAQLGEHLKEGFQKWNYSATIFKKPVKLVVGGSSPSRGAILYNGTLLCTTIIIVYLR